MRTITTTELKENFDKYLELGQIEEINVVHNGEYIFTIVPNKENNHQNGNGRKKYRKTYL